MKWPERPTDPFPIGDHRETKRDQFATLLAVKSSLLWTVAGVVGLAFGCGHDEDPFGADTTSAMSSTSGECSPGLESCPCAAPPNECSGNLVCLDDVCARVPVEDDSGGVPPPPTTTGGDTSNDETGTSACVDDLDCLDTEVCIDAECSDVWSHTWAMTVLTFEPASCVEEFGDLDPDYLVWRSDDLLTDSPEDGCPSSWPDLDTLIEPFDPSVDYLLIDFWDNDFFTDPEHICTWGWDSLGNGEYGPIPRFMLHDGYWAGSFDGDACYAEILFTLVE